MSFEVSGNGKVLMFIAIIGVALFLYFKIKSKFKVPRTGCLSLISGSVKSGKSTLGVYMAISQYKKNLRAWKLDCILCKIFRKEPQEKPLLYSNIPLAYPHVRLTKDLLSRKKRFAFHSVVYINEASLVVDNQIYQDKDLSERVKLLVKLFGHECHAGGSRLILDTQAIGDVSIEVRRTLSEYFYIHHLVRWIPFFLLAYVREERYSEDGSSINAYNEDLENSLKKVLIPKRTWKYFDHCCFSALTDNLPVEQFVVENRQDDLKCNDILSFREYTSLKKEEPKKIIKIVPEDIKNEKEEH